MILQVRWTDKGARPINAPWNIVQVEYDRLEQFCAALDRGPVVVSILHTEGSAQRFQFNVVGTSEAEISKSDIMIMHVSWLTYVRDGVPA